MFADGREGVMIGYRQRRLVCRRVRRKTRCVRGENMKKDSVEVLDTATGEKVRVCRETTTLQIYLCSKEFGQKPKQVTEAFAVPLPLSETSTQEADEQSKTARCSKRSKATTGCACVLRGVSQKALDIVWQSPERARAPTF